MLKIKPHFLLHFAIPAVEVTYSRIHVTKLREDVLEIVHVLSTWPRTPHTAGLKVVVYFQPGNWQVLQTRAFSPQKKPVVEH